METTGKIIAALGLGVLAGAAINEAIQNQCKTDADLMNEQNKLREKLIDQNLEIDRLRREQNRLSEKVDSHRSVPQ